MTNIEQKALELANEVLESCGGIAKLPQIDRYNPYARALCRAIEQHEAFRQEVSDAVEEIAKAWGTTDPAWGYIRRFIIAKPDPIEEASEEALSQPDKPFLESLRAALAKRGLEIREKSNG